MRTFAPADDKGRTLDWRTIVNDVLLIDLFVTMIAMFNQINGRMNGMQAETNARFDPMQAETNVRFDAVKAGSTPCRSKTSVSTTTSTAASMRCSGPSRFREADFPSRRAS